LTGCGPADLDYEKQSEETPWSFVDWDSCSASIDDHACNFTLEDKDKKEVSLYDFYDQIIILDISAMWCGPCNAAASDIAEVKLIYPGINYITVLVENEYGEPPTQEDLKNWSTRHSIDEPVLRSDRSFISHDPNEGWPIEGWPTFYYIGKDMIIEHGHAGYSNQLISQNIQALDSNN